MVQKEVKKKTSVYGATAVLLAVVLVSSVYVLGSAPIIFPSGSPMVGGMKTFQSNQELSEYLNSNTNGYSGYYGGPLDTRFFGEPMPRAVPSSADLGFFGAQSESTGSYNVNSYSTTNIQVSGVDEADTVKSDGYYIYTVSNTQNSGYYYDSYGDSGVSAVYIVNADPENAQVVSKIILDNDTEVAGLFLSSDCKPSCGYRQQIPVLLCSSRRKN